MQMISAQELAGIFNFPDLVKALRGGFERGAVLPLRHHHSIALVGEPDATLLLMPAWHAQDARPGGGFLGVKMVMVYPGNAARGKPSVNGVYVLMEASGGEPLAIIDGRALTLWRTAAASALAASFLAQSDARRLVMVGAGALAPYLIRAHASVRPIAEVHVWNRSLPRAERLAADLSAEAFSVAAVGDLQKAVRAADVVSCATLATDPLVKGAWLKPGTHLDLVGGFTREMREADDEAVRRARVYIDTRDALKEAGDLIQPLAAGVKRETDIVGDLFDLCRGAVSGRRSTQEITLFKSVGTALEDLTAAAFAYRLLRPSMS
jgi:ornithine cyclodeaminase/alanine dehydrogenase-like protein (mu-crystallin family)